MKHTEGPWQVGNLIKNDFEVRYVEIKGADGLKRIAKATYGQTDEEAIANAHVLAASTELLDACQFAMNKLCELEQDAQRDGTAIFIVEELDKLEKAIIKARG